MRATRRETIIGGAAVAVSIICQPVAAAVIPKLGCGCPRLYNPSFGHTCCVHDDKGRRWDDYTTDEMATMSNDVLEVQTADTQWSCYCSKCDAYDDNMPPPGTRFVWRKTSYEYDEWESDCEHAYRQEWLGVQTTDWIAMAAEDGARVT